MIASGAEGVSKPDSRIFEIACRAVGQPARSCLMVGDNPLADVLGAQQAGLTAVLLDRHGRAGAEHAHLPTISSLAELVSGPGRVRTAHQP